MDFLTLVETYRAEEAHRAVESERGYRPAAHGIRRHPQYAQMVVEAMDILEAARTSRSGMRRFEEAMGTPDFPLLMGDVLQRQVLGTYAETPQTWSMVARRGVVPDFRTVKRLSLIHI